MTKRVAIGKKVRFEIFKRDLFTCQYCGSFPPAVVLEVDHIKPVAEGGDNQTDNLLTSCFDCNRGKGAIPLSEATQAVAEKIAVQKERQEQLKEFERLLAKQNTALNRKVRVLDKVFQEETECQFTANFKKSAKHFFTCLPKQSIHEAMEIALSQEFSDHEITLKYFCKICWNRIRETENG